MKMNLEVYRFLEAIDKKYTPQAVSALAAIMELSDENEALRANVAEARADTLKEMQIKFAMHFGTYTKDDTIKVSDVFKLLSKFTEEMLEEV